MDDTLLRGRLKLLYKMGTSVGRREPRLYDKVHKREMGGVSSRLGNMQ